MTEHDTIHEIMLVPKALLHYPQCGGITLDGLIVANLRVKKIKVR